MKAGIQAGIRQWPEPINWSRLRWTWPKSWVVHKTLSTNKSPSAVSTTFWIFMNIPQTTSSPKKTGWINFQPSKIEPLKKGCTCFTGKSQVITWRQQIPNPRNSIVVLKGSIPSPDRVGMMVDLNPIPESKEFLRGKCRNLRTFWLVVEPTPSKTMPVKLDIFPRDWGEHKKYLSCHHPLDILLELLRISMFSHSFFKTDWKGGTQHHPGPRHRP